MISEEMEMQGMGAEPAPEWFNGFIQAVSGEAILPKDARVKSLWELLKQRQLLAQSVWLRSLLLRIWQQGLPGPAPAQDYATAEATLTAMGYSPGSVANSGGHTGPLGRARGPSPAILEKAPAVPPGRVPAVTASRVSAAATGRVSSVTSGRLSAAAADRFPPLLPGGRPPLATGPGQTSKTGAGPADGPGASPALGGETLRSPVRPYDRALPLDQDLGQIDDYIPQGMELYAKFNNYAPARVLRVPTAG